MTLLPIVTPSVPKQNGTSGSVEERVTLDTPKMAYRHVLLPSSHGVNTFAVDVMASSEYHVTAWAMLPCVPDALPYIGVSPSAYAPDSAARQTAMASLRSLETIPFCSFTSGLLSLCKYKYHTIIRIVPQASSGGNRQRGRNKLRPSRMESRHLGGAARGDARPPDVAAATAR